ncbi:Crp/Fnr family transcriptional regulator [Bradyrhizobium sp. CB3481]|uniref:Crp/Fnr family transcriptional regulator n=1 Tax=Bradyrhizobium sp. CB3481 TaxID=3039158 RepID=UPI0024B1A60E|nr:Crp/Fnr family transcriptional regulator [Bradyrhizobium sp. CB3481]WFU18641.1 Crp/Fnr family transcriptional regulator [Bradyrhizobium sp. CB3481]
MQSENLLLNQLNASTYSKIAPALIAVNLERGHELARPRERVHRAYFPYGGAISCVVKLPGGDAIETAMIGKDGEWGAAQALDDKVSLNGVMVQIAGKGSAIEADRLRRLADELPDLRALLMRYEHFFSAQVQQTAACNAVHQVEPRLCRWLLRLYDLVGPDYMITQEFMAEMMGVRRTSVTTIASNLQKAGAISYSRGQVHIHDVSILEARSCECRAEIRLHYEELFHPQELNRID